MFVRRFRSSLAFIVSIQSIDRNPLALSYRFISLAPGVATRAKRNSKRWELGTTKGAGNDLSDMSIEKKESTDFDDSKHQLFGRFKITPDQIFLRTTYSFAMVNLRPIVPGHVLICPIRIAPLLSDLGDDEHDDLWRTVRTVQRVLRRRYECVAFNVAVQDGPEAGQSVPHAHVHILPRYRGDLERNDDIYDKLEAWAPRDENVPKGMTKLHVPDDGERRDRTVEEMAAEAATYQSLILELFP
jgi:bis(5'-adenosyl)-triphosphatase